MVNTDLLPHLRGLKNRPDASPRQKVISEIMTGVERVRIDTERNFLDVLDKVKDLTGQARDLAAKAKEIEDAVYDLKAVNPHKRTVVDTRTPEELMAIIEAKGLEVAEALLILRASR